ncbi:MAG: hypothetical protein ACRC2T_18105 [Thermoguttaceae bacterium]
MLRYSLKSQLKLFALPLLFFLIGTVVATEVHLRDGRIYFGEINEIAKVEVKVAPGTAVQSKGVTVVDDGLRRIFLPKKLVTAALPNALPTNKFLFDQRFASGENAERFVAVGDCRAENFDEYGRRIVEFAKPNGSDKEVQAIIEINSKYIRTRGMKNVWDARYATNSIPQSILTPILRQKIDPSSFDERLQLFNFYLLARYYEHALAELDSIMQDFGSDPNIESQIQSLRRKMKQLNAERTENELIMRSEAGQHKLVTELLRNFDGRDISQTILQRIKRMLERYENFEKYRDALLLRLQNYADKIGDETLRSKIEDVLDEIEAEVSSSTISRLSAFELNEKDPALSDEEKLAIAISGWLIGNKADNKRLTVAISLFETRQLIVQYLLEADQKKREDIFSSIKKQEAGTTDLVAALLKLMKPPKDTEVFDPNRPGFFELERSGIAGSVEYSKIKYLVQLPPEYDPNISYPTIIALHPSNWGAEREMQWWTGPWVDGNRFGQAGRHGFIVISPLWGLPGQVNYDNSPLAHAAVLYAYRDALERFSIDTDKVFISGHGMGGSAAWDIALAHPDLWAGVIPICASSNGVIDSYKENAKYVPFYYIGGELEFDTTGNGFGSKLTINGKSFNHYLNSGYNATVVLFLGRGPEAYQEEQFELFAWMKRNKREIPTDFTVKSVRPLNNFYFFWNIDYPVLPDESTWSASRGSLPMIETNSRFIERNNKLKVTTKGASGVSPKIFLTPEMISFDQRVDIEVNDKKYQPRGGFLEPDLTVMLEDARTRRDRLHPFWTMVDANTR